ncbi:hypothetical protein OEZ86_012845 [Tetradesmus obliquus]|nr:hypothetical protein OEZ86_012845 [Tetradesmus obliquus]
MVLQVFQGKRVLIISGGTRGDVQPATALGVALAGLGAHVCVAADAMFGGFVQQQRLAYRQLAGDARGMMALTVKWGGMLPTELSGMSWLRSQIAAVMDSVAAAAEGWQPDIILANQLAYGQVHVAEKLQVPLHILLTIPWMPTTAIAHPWARAWGANITEYINAAAEALLRPGFTLLALFAPKMSARMKAAAMRRVAAWGNWISTPLLDHTAWWGIADLMTSFRRQLGLPLLSTNNSGGALYRLPTTCLFSTALVPRPPDWGSNVTLAGFLSLSDAAARFGAAAAASAAAGSGGGGSSSSSTRVLCIKEAPHEWLFPRCSALVHHGGVGTTAAGLRCGKPTVVVPAFGDLFFFADMCHKLGVGPDPIPLPELTADRLLAALQQLVAEHGRYSAAAAGVADQLRREDGLAAAVASVAHCSDDWASDSQEYYSDVDSDDEDEERAGVPVPLRCERQYQELCRARAVARSRLHQAQATVQQQ